MTVKFHKVLLGPATFREYQFTQLFSMVTPVSVPANTAICLHTESHQCMYYNEAPKLPSNAAMVHNWHLEGSYSLHTIHQRTWLILGLTFDCSQKPWVTNIHAFTFIITFQKCHAFMDMFMANFYNHTDTGTYHTSKNYKCYCRGAG